MLYSPGVEIEWNPHKAEGNLAKHRVSFVEAATALLDPLAVTVPDPDHSEVEDRWITVGASVAGRALIISHTEFGDRIRIISARLLTRAERKTHESSDI